MPSDQTKERLLDLGDAIVKFVEEKVEGIRALYQELENKVTKNSADLDKKAFRTSVDDQQKRIDLLEKRIQELDQRVKMLEPESEVQQSPSSQENPDNLDPTGIKHSPE